MNTDTMTTAESVPCSHDELIAEMWNEVGQREFEQYLRWLRQQGFHSLTDEQIRALDWKDYTPIDEG